MRSLPWWSAAALLSAPLVARGLGLGDIEHESALNQPFRAEIELTSVTDEELEGLQVGLASRETFSRYGLERTAELNSLSFDLARGDAGEPVIRVTSRVPISDPFLTMLVEVSWPRGRLLREYTVLLDPPLFTPDVGGEAPIRQAEQGAAPNSSGGAIARAPDEAPVDVDVGGARTPSAGESPAAGEPPASGPAEASADGSYGPVRDAETLWSIASQLRPADVTTNQMMVALYEANPDAFDGNMNVLLRGATLALPDRGQVTAIDPDAATAEVSRHDESWAAGAAAEEPVRQADAGAADEDAREARLRLVPPSVDGAEGGSGASGAQGGGAADDGGAAASSEAVQAANAEITRLEEQVSTLRGELEENRRLLELRNEQLQSLQARLERLEAGEAPVDAPEPADGVAGVDLEAEERDEPVFADEGPAAGEADGGGAADGPDADEAGAGDEPEVADAGAAGDGEPASADAAETAAPPAVSTRSQPSLLSRVIGWISNPLLLIGLGVGAVLLTALWYLRNRREDVEDVEDVTGRWDALEAEVEEEAREATARVSQARDDSVVVDERPAGGAGAAAAGSAGADVGAAAGGAAADGAEGAGLDDTGSGQTVIDFEQGDSLAEADFHMAYGLYDQAAELVQKALESEPGRRDLKLKLLEVYFVWGNKDAFRDAARELKQSLGDGGDADWDKVLIMGKQLCPDDELFAGKAGGGSVDVDLPTGESTDLDFAFDDKGDGADGGGDASFDGLDFDLAATGNRLGGDTAGDGDAFGLDDGDGSGIARHAGGNDDAGGEPGEAAGMSGGGDGDFDFDSLGIGESTAAGLEAALFDEDEDENASADDGGRTDVAGVGEDSEPTAAGDDAGATSPGLDFDALAATQETPTVETPRSDVDEEDWTAALGLDETGTETAGGESPSVESTVETLGADSPTVETLGADSPTVETAAGEDIFGPDSPTMETLAADPTSSEPTATDLSLDDEPAQGPGAGTAELPTVEQSGIGSAGGGENTEEIDLDDLGLSVSDLEDLPGEAGESDTREQPALEADDELLSASGVTEIIDETALADDDAGQPGSDDDGGTQDLDAGSGTSVLSAQEETLLASGGTHVLGNDGLGAGAGEDEGTGQTSMIKAFDPGEPGQSDGSGDGSGLDLDLDDLAGALSGGETVEQPAASSADAGSYYGDGGGSLDLDVGYDEPASDDPASTEDVGALDPQTMTEVGTKLDLARAYIDMGDPEGARSILEEVLDEGDAGQRREAQGLIDALAG